jgi:uncharacterized membrane protein (UPF0127 family)
MKRNRIIAALIVALIIIVFSRGFKFFHTDKRLDSQNTNYTTDPSGIPDSVLNLQDRQMLDLQIGDAQLQVEVVLSPESRQQGLSGRTEIGSDGMLFIFPELMQTRFWMLDMQFGLDFVWIARGEVVDFTPNVPPPGASVTRSELPTYGPNTPVDWVLEIPAGSIEEYGIELGETVKKCYHNKCYE